MGTEIIVAVVLAMVIAFGVACSVILNCVLVVGLVTSVLFSRNVLKENAALSQEMSELDSQLIVSDSVNDIIEHVLLLRDQLFEIMQMDMYTGEPTMQGLMETINITLEKIEQSVINQEYQRSLEDI